MRRGKPVRGDLNFAATEAAGPLLLEPVLAVESQAWRSRQSGCRDTAREVTPYKLWTCHCNIGRASESHAVATLNRLGVCGHRCQYLSRAEPFDCMLLIIERFFDVRLLVCGELGQRCDEPGAQAICVHRQSQSYAACLSARLHEFRKRSTQLLLQ